MPCGEHEMFGFLLACAAMVFMRWSIGQEQKNPNPTKKGRRGRGKDSEAAKFERMNALNQQQFAHRGKRALVDSELHGLVETGAFQFHFTNPVPKPVNLHSYVQPASIDLPVTGSAFLVKEKVLPFHHRVIDLVHDLTLERKPLVGDGVVLLKGQTYLV